MIFLRPGFLILIFLPFLLFFIKKETAAANPWKKIIDPVLLAYLTVKSNILKNKKRSTLLWVLWGMWVIALAGPAFDKYPVPAWHENKGTVIVADVTQTFDPENIRTLHTKLYDLLLILQRNKQSAALVLYDVKGYVGVPLTGDIDLIKAMVPAVVPHVLPVGENRPETGIKKARELLDNVPGGHGRILFVTGGGFDAEKLGREIQNIPYPIGILGIGSEQNAHPVPLPGGGFLKNQNGETVLVRLDPGALSKLGAYHIKTPSDSDWTYLLSKTDYAGAGGYTAGEKTIEIWKDAGIYLVLLSVPFFLLLFRRGFFVFALIFCSVCSAHATPWLRQDQIEYRRMEEGIRLYKEKQYAPARGAFSGVSGDVSYYNTGNAFAYEGAYAKAIESYAKALEINPKNADAAYNKAYLEERLKEQRKEEERADKEGAENEAPPKNEAEGEEQGTRKNKEVPEEQAAQTDQNSTAIQNDPGNQPLDVDIPPEEMAAPQMQEEMKEQGVDQETQQIFNKLPTDLSRLLRYRILKQYQQGVQK
ncbi:MAG: tetratricopeptide repeat protein [Lactobacillales bacterium]|nr:tetratricopeptide repeat protein [Lactobacillales bacterium]